MNLISPKLNYVFPLKWWYKLKTHHSEMGRPHHLRLHSGLLSWTLGYYSLLCSPIGGCSFFKMLGDGHSNYCWMSLFWEGITRNKKNIYEGRDWLSPPIWLCLSSYGLQMDIWRFAFTMISHQQIFLLRLFLFLLVLAVLINVLSWAYCTSHKFNFIIIKISNKRTLEPKTMS